MVNEKDTAIQNIVIDYILSEREKLGLPAPAPSIELGAAARDTAEWLASEEDPEDRILDYLSARVAERIRNTTFILFPELACGRNLWPANAEPSEIARDLIELAGLSEVASFPALDYLGISSSCGYYDQSRNSVEVSGGQPVGFGYALMVAYASDGNRAIVDRINEKRRGVGVAPLQVSASLLDMARKFVPVPYDDVTRDVISREAELSGYFVEGWRVRLDYLGSYVKFPSCGENSVAEPQMAEIIASQLVREWPTLLRPDWQDIGIATGVKNHPSLGGLNFQAEFVIGWRIPDDAERPAHFPPPIDSGGSPITTNEESTRRDSNGKIDALRGPVYREPQPKPQRRRGWWPF